MKDEINYQKFSNFLQEEIALEGQRIWHSVAMNTLTNWDALSYYGHVSSNLTIQDISKCSHVTLEQTFKIVKYLTKKGLLKREMIKNKNTNGVCIYYCINENFHDLKNKYISTYELDWDGILTWDIYYKTYKQNREIFHALDSFLKLQVNEYKVNEKVYQKLQNIKNEYILKIAREMSYENRVLLKIEAMKEIKRQIEI